MCLEINILQLNCNLLKVKDHDVYYMHYIGILKVQSKISVSICYRNLHPSPHQTKQNSKGVLSAQKDREIISPKGRRIEEISLGVLRCCESSSLNSQEFEMMSDMELQVSEGKKTGMYNCPGINYRPLQCYLLA